MAEGHTPTHGAVYAMLCWHSMHAASVFGFLISSFLSFSFPASLSLYLLCFLSCSICHSICISLYTILFVLLPLLLLLPQRRCRCMSLCQDCDKRTCGFACSKYAHDRVRVRCLSRSIHECPSRLIPHRSASCTFHIKDMQVVHGVHVHDGAA